MSWWGSLPAGIFWRGSRSSVKRRLNRFVSTFTGRRPTWLDGGSADQSGRIVTLPALLDPAAPAKCARRVRITESFESLFHRLHGACEGTLQPLPGRGYADNLSVV